MSDWGRFSQLFDDNGLIKLVITALPFHIIYFPFKII